MPWQLSAIFTGILPAAAALSLIVGPSPSAVSAEYQHRAVQTERQRNDGRTAAEKDNSSSGRSDTPSGDSHGEGAFEAFVAPASAKPAETQNAPVQLCLAGSSNDIDARPVFSALVRVPLVRHLTPLHHPAYRATAPPRH